MKTNILKVVISSILVFTLVFTNFMVDGNAAYIDNTSDLALLGPASSGSEQNNHAAFFGNDGDTHSRWCAASGSTGQWWQTDLQGYYDLNKISIKFEKNNVNYKYTIQGSSDSVNWTTISDQSNSASISQKQDLTLSASNIRYVKITFSSISGGNWASFYDFNVYGLRTPGKNVALNAVAFGDSEGLANRAMYAVDGDPATRWAAENGNANHYVKLDLGQLYNISGSKLNWEKSGVTYKYKIEVSSDHVTWQTALDKTGNTRTEQIQQEDFTASNVRFVRLTVTGISSGYWASINELEMFGTLSPVSNIASGKQSKADSAEASNPAANANDGSATTRWSANDGGANHWWQVDFNGLADLTGTEMKWEKSGVTYKYKIEVSTNEQNWTTVVDKTSNNPSLAQIQTDAFITTNVRFLRITVTGISGGNYASMYDVKVNGRIVRDETVLNLEAKKDFDYFWNHASMAPAAFGLIQEGNYANSKGYPANAASISSTGFGLTAIPIGVSRDWITWQQGYDRALGTLNTLRTLQVNKSYKGHLYHYYGFNDGSNGSIYNKASCILDTVLMMNGVIMAGEYFGGAVKAKADEIFNATDWEAFRDPVSKHFYMEYDFGDATFDKPARTPGFTKKTNGTFDLNDHFNEGFLMHIYGAGSSTHPLADMDSFYKWAFPKKKYGFNVMQVVSGTDFVHQYPQQIVDFRNLVDKNGVDWWSNGIIAAMNARKFATDYQDVHKGFGPDSWGLVACEPIIGKYRYFGSAPVSESNNSDYNSETKLNQLVYANANLNLAGTISPSGPAGFLNMIPKYGTRVLDNYYYNLKDLTWDDTLGFVDAFNRNTGLSTDYVLAYDKGIALQAIENNRTGLIWNYVIKNNAVQNGLNKAGFRVKTDQ